MVGGQLGKGMGRGKNAPTSEDDGCRVMECDPEHEQDQGGDWRATNGQRKWHAGHGQYTVGCRARVQNWYNLYN